MSTHALSGRLAYFWLLLLVPQVWATQQINACYQPPQGNLRIVASIDDCKKNELPLSWSAGNSSGSIPAGAALLFPSCPAGWVAAGPMLGGLTPLIPCTQQTSTGQSPPALGLGSVSGSLLVNQLDFGTQAPTPTALTQLAQRASDLLGYSTGGSNDYAVALSYDVLNRVESATLAKRGPDVMYYDPAGKRADYLVAVGTGKMGVLVTRASAYPPGSLYSLTMASSLLTSKLTSAQNVMANLMPAEGATNMILFVFAFDPEVVAQLQQAYNLLMPAVKGSTIVYITVTHGDDQFLYY